MMTAVAKTRAEIGLLKRERTRAKVIAAAARVIAAFGERKVTIDDVIREADVSRGTFYNCFATREDLFDALWTVVGRNPFVEIQRAVAGVADPAERLVCETRLVFARTRLDPTWGWLIFAFSGDPETVNDDLRSFPSPDLEAGRTAGRLDFADLASARDLVVGAVRAGMKSILTDHPNPDYDQALCALVLRSLGLTRAEAVRIAGKPLPSLR